MTAVLSSPATDRAGEDNQWTKCPSCSGLLYLRRLRRQSWVCPDCAHPLRLSAADRLDLLTDPGSFDRRDAGLTATDVLGFTDTKPYPQRLADARRRTGQSEAVLWGGATVGGHPVTIAVMDFAFLGGSVGAVTGELIARAARHALAERTPLVLVTASGGARMQEGVLSLMQLAKTSQELGRLREAGLLCVNVLTDPTYGGATASFAVLGDVLIAEPGARVGFAGPSVIEQTIRQKLPENFQRAESLYRDGLIDMVVPREELRATLVRLLRAHTRTEAEPAAADPAGATLLTDPIALSPRRAAEVVRGARKIGRPTTLDYCAGVFTDFVELHGDRVSGDDPAVVAGVASLDGRPVVVIGHQKGRETRELVKRNFGMPQPSGYHKARRMMEYADRLGLPVITFVDTPGAYPGVEAEERGQGHAIAECIRTSARLRVPVISVVTGEGGSGGALALATANRLLMLSGAYFSVISPEGCATILFGSAAEAERAADSLRITARDLLELEVVDGVIPEPAEGAHTDPATTVRTVGAALRRALAEFDGWSADDLVGQRYDRHARMKGRNDE